MKTTFASLGGRGPFLQCGEGPSRTPDQNPISKYEQIVKICHFYQQTALITCILGVLEEEIGVAEK